MPVRNLLRKRLAAAKRGRNDARRAFAESPNLDTRRDLIDAHKLVENISQAISVLRRG